jgi:cytochrome d ubiquinol oxidase subunit II
MGYKHRFRYGVFEGLGFDGIGVAFIGRNSPFGVVLAALLFGILDHGGLAIDVSTRVPREIVLVLKAAILIFVVVSVWTPLVDDYVRERWFGNVSWLWLIPALTLLLAALVWRWVHSGFEVLPFLGTIGLFVLFYGGLLFSKWPYVVPPNYTFHDAASAPESQLFLLIGVLFVIPFVLMYTAWTYYVFRGKVTAGATAYH